MAGWIKLFVKLHSKYRFMKKVLLLQLFSFALVALASMSFKMAETPATSLTADQDPWEMLGMRKVNYGLDRDEIVVTRAEGVFTALQIRVKGSPINMHKVVVHFGNGETQEFDLRENFRAGGRHRPIFNLVFERVERFRIFHLRQIITMISLRLRPD